MINILMDQENAFSQASYMKGVSVDTPWFKFRYVKIKGNASDQTSQRKRIDDVVPKREEKISPSKIKTEFVYPARVETMGFDPMVSSAAVIHELAYGRMQDSPNLMRPDAGYYLTSNVTVAQLNIIV